MSIGYWRASAAILLAGIAGCAAVPLEPGKARVHELVQARSGAALPANAAHVDQSVQALLREPLQLPAAVQIALLRNPTLQLEFARLGIGAADAFEASRLSNPGVNFALLFPTGGASGNKLTAGATLGFSDLLLRPVRGRIAASEYLRTQELVAASILDLALDVQRAWFDCVGASQRAAVRRSIGESAQSAAALAARYHQAGNIDQIALQLQAAAASEARIASTQADADAAEARGHLQNLLGLSPADAQWTVPDSLPAPVTAAADPAKLQTRALEQRLDLAAARYQVAAAEQQLSAAHRFRYLSPVDLGVAGEREADGSTRVGPSLSLKLPLFNQGQGVIARAQAQLDSARATQKLLEARIGSEVQMQATRMHSAFEQAAAYHDGLIPQREAVVARLQEQVNFMLTDTFNLLLAKQQEYAAYLGYVDTVHRYWQARVELTRAVGRRLPDDSTPIPQTPQVQP